MEDVHQEKCFRHNDTLYYLWIKFPSKPHGGWPGNAVTIRDWSKMRKEQSGAATKCSKSEMIEAELSLGELKTVEFIEHPTRGLVVKG